MAFRNEKHEKYSAAVGSKELTNMKKEDETQTIEKWLKALDKPLPTKYGSIKRRKAKRRGKQ